MTIFDDLGAAIDGARRGLRPEEYHRVTFVINEAAIEDIERSIGALAPDSDITQTRRATGQVTLHGCKGSVAPIDEADEEIEPRFRITLL